MDESQQSRKCLAEYIFRIWLGQNTAAARSFTAALEHKEAKGEMNQGVPVLGKQRTDVVP